MFKKAISSLVCLPLVAGLAFAQGPNTTTTTMVCSTTDGTLRISDHMVTLADYNLRFDTVLQDGVIRFVDTRSSAVAVLDARGDQGLYLLIDEGGKTMQVVASRSDIRYEANDRGSEPASPSLSSVLDLVNAASPAK